jgi:hypothetical protein
MLDWGTMVALTQFPPWRLRLGATDLLLVGSLLSSLGRGVTLFRFVDVVGDSAEVVCSRFHFSICARYKARMIGSALIYVSGHDASLGGLVTFGHACIF